MVRNFYLKHLHLSSRCFYYWLSHTIKESNSNNYRPGLTNLHSKFLKQINLHICYILSDFTTQETIPTSMLSLNYLHFQSLLYKYTVEFDSSICCYPFRNYFHRMQNPEKEKSDFLHFFGTGKIVIFSREILSFFKFVGTWSEIFISGFSNYLPDVFISV